MTKQQLKEKELKLREEKLKILGDKFELRKKVWEDIKGKQITGQVAEVVKMILK